MADVCEFRLIFCAEFVKHGLEMIMALQKCGNLVILGFISLPSKPIESCTASLGSLVQRSHTTSPSDAEGTTPATLNSRKASVFMICS